MLDMQRRRRLALVSRQFRQSANEAVRLILRKHPASVDVDISRNVPALNPKNGDKTLFSRVFVRDETQPSTMTFVCAGAAGQPCIVRNAKRHIPHKVTVSIRDPYLARGTSLVYTIAYSLKEGQEDNVRKFGTLSKISRPEGCAHGRVQWQLLSLSIRHWELVKCPSAERMPFLLGSHELPARLFRLLNAYGGASLAVPVPCLHDGLAAAAGDDGKDTHEDTHA